MERQMVEWDCPNCGHTNTDFQDQHTHCACCGLVVYVLNEDGLINSEDWYVKDFDRECYEEDGS
jgi:transcription initiation factor TFIIIB Brf1 subunit/transcription initiation factor TFIIB